MSCKYAIETVEYHGWVCSKTNGPCAFKYPDSKQCAEKYGYGPDAAEGARLFADNEAMKQEWKEAHDELKAIRADLARVTAERNTAVESALFHSEQCEKQAADIKRLRAALEVETSRRYQAECNYDNWKSQCARVTAERDAAIQNIESVGHANVGLCALCANNTMPDAPCIIKNGGQCVFKWSGLQPEVPPHA